MTVQRDTIVKKVAEGRALSNEGIISTFGVLITRLPVAFWNTFPERILKAAPVDKKPEIEEMLVKCAHESGYHTGQAILTSPQWKAVVEPMITEGPKDVLRGLFAVLTAAGWAKTGIVQIKDGERMVIRGLDYYEADGEPGDKRAFMIRGYAAAFFDLAYGPAYPNGMGISVCEQVAGIECGDPFGEFVVTKK